MKKKLAALMCSVMLLASVASCGAKDEGKKQFVVGFDSEFPPMGFVADDGSYTGFDLDLAEEVAKRLDMEFVAQPIAWDAKDQELASGNIDCIWNGFTINPEINRICGVLSGFDIDKEKEAGLILEPAEKISTHGLTHIWKTIR